MSTWDTVIARTPEGSFTNWSIARIMMIDGKHMTGPVVHPQHIAYVWQQWADLGKDMPFALVQGGPPVLVFVSGMPLPTESRKPATSVRSPVNPSSWSRARRWTCRCRHSRRS